MSSPAQWVPIAGLWQLPLADTAPDEEILYVGPGPRQAQPYGLAISDLSLTHGVASVTVTLSGISGVAAGLVVGFSSATAPYVMAELGAHESAYAISYYEPALGWYSHPTVAAKEVLIRARPYLVAITVGAGQVQMFVDGVRVIHEHLRHQLVGNNVGLYAWGEHGAVSFKHLSVEEEDDAPPRGEVRGTTQFAQSDDLQTVTMNGETFSLTRAQGAVIRRLKSAKDQGVPHVRWPRLREAAEAVGNYPKSMGDVFDTELRDKLMHVVGKGIYEINLPS